MPAYNEGAGEPVRPALYLTIVTLKILQKIFLKILGVKMKKESKVYDLKMKSREYRDKTLYSVYYKPREKPERKFKPIDIDGYRYRMNLETGEITLYSRDLTQLSKMSSVKRSRIYLDMLLEMNDFNCFVTLTFDKLRVERSNSIKVYDAYSKFIFGIKKKYPWCRYITVAERHKDGCYHFHLLMGGLTVQEMGLVKTDKVCCHWARKNGICSKEYFELTKDRYTLEETDGIQLYNMTIFPYGFSTVSLIQSRERCNAYVKKYIDKNFGSTEDFKKRFFYSSNLKFPKIEDRTINSSKVIKDISKLGVINNSALYEYSEMQRYNKDFNTLQFWVDNEYKSALEKDLIPMELLEDVQIEIKEEK